MSEASLAAVVVVGVAVVKVVDGIVVFEAGIGVVVADSTSRKSDAFWILSRSVIFFNIGFAAFSCSTFWAAPFSSLSATSLNAILIPDMENAQIQIQSKTVLRAFRICFTIVTWRMSFCFVLSVVGVSHNLNLKSPFAYGKPNYMSMLTFSLSVRL